LEGLSAKLKELGDGLTFFQFFWYQNFAENYQGKEKTTVDLEKKCILKINEIISRQKKLASLKLFLKFLSFVF